MRLNHHHHRNTSNQDVCKMATVEPTRVVWRYEIFFSHDIGAAEGVIEELTDFDCYFEASRHAQASIRSVNAPNEPCYRFMWAHIRQVWHGFDGGEFHECPFLG